MITVKRTEVKGTWKKVSNTIKRNLQKAGALEIGVLKDSQLYPDGTEPADVAYWNEYGTDTIPARFWLSGAIKHNQQFVRDTIKRINSRYPLNSNAYQIAMNEFGRQLKTKIIATVENNDIEMAGNAPSTQTAKGGDTPIVDTGHLLRQINFKLIGGINNA